MNNAETAKHLKTIVGSMPECPGCYQYLDKDGVIIYVGKAKNLKRRVSSYFNREHDSFKTSILVSKICDIKYIVVNTEEDALLLENNLIKQWNPRYNVLLKDGKTYPSICVTNEYLPRVLFTRKIIKGAGTYFGPYSHTPTLQALLELIKNLYPLRRCRDKIGPESIAANKHRLCLEYHIKNCKGPCCNLQSRDEYMGYIREAIEILKGNTVDVERRMLVEMQALAEELRFEEAEVLKKKYQLIENYRNRSEVVSNTLHNIDVFNIEDDETCAYINYLHVVNGCINQAFTFEYAKRLNETSEELLVAGIGEMRARYRSESREIIVPFHVELCLENVVFTVPQRGDKRKLLSLSHLNALQYKKDRLDQKDKLNPEQKQVRCLKELQDVLGLPTLPMHIECFDNSNIGGEDAVAACVVFRKAKPSKQDYRKYNIKTVQGPDDYASMKEVVLRRYSRMVDEGTPLPDLIVADGGKGQMEVIREAVEDVLGLKIPIAGLAKNDRHRTNELLYGFPAQTVGLRTDSALFHMLTRLQDEVHRFAITFHRDKRSKRQVASQLDAIPGIGPRSKELLLKQFRSLARIRQASLEELTDCIGKTKGNALYNHLHLAITPNN